MFKLTPMQRQGRKILNGPAPNVLAVGGSRSGKTTLILRNILLRAAMTPNSRHLVFRSVRSDLVRAVWQDSLPKVLNEDFNGLAFKKDEKNLVMRLPHNKSEIWLGFLNESGSLESVLGNATLPHTQSTLRSVTFLLFSSFTAESKTNSNRTCI